MWKNQVEIDIKHLSHLLRHRKIHTSKSTQLKMWAVMLLVTSSWPRDIKFGDNVELDKYLGKSSVHTVTAVHFIKNIRI